MKTMQTGPMTTLKQRATHLALGLGLAATLAFGAVMPALAAPEPVTGTVSVEGAEAVVFTVADTVALTDPTNLIDGKVVLDGKEHTATGLLPIAVVDNTGTGNGWVLQISSTDFTDQTDLSTNTIGMADLGFSVTGTVVVADQDNDGAITPPADGAALTISNADQTLFTAAEGTGQGTYALTVGFELELPGTTKVGAYEADITITTVSGQLPD